MTELSSTLAEAVLALPESDRAEIARRLIASLDDVSPASHQTAWAEVARRRAAEIAEGKDVTVSVEEALRRTRESLR